MKKGNSFTLNIMITLMILMGVSIIYMTGCGGGGVTGITPNLSTPTPNVIVQGKKYLGINADPNTFIAGVDVTNGSSQLNSGATQYTAPISADGYGTMEIDSFVEVIDLYVFNNEQEYLDQAQARFKTTENIGIGANPNVTIVIPPNPTPPPTLPPPDPTETPTPVPTVPPGPTNQAPYAPSNLSPSNGATNQPLSVDISAYYNDPEGSPGTVSFYEAVSGQLIGSVNVNHGEKATVTWAGLSYSTTYAWYAVANDGENDSPFSETYDFTTRDEPTPDPTPTNTPIPNPDPVIAQDSMRGGVIGKNSTIKGTGFGPNEPGATVVFNDSTNANIVDWTDTLITYVVPSVGLADANHVSCKVTTSGGKSVTNNYFLTMSEPVSIYNVWTSDSYIASDATLDNSNNIYLSGENNKIIKYSWPSFTNKTTTTNLITSPLGISFVSSNNRLYTTLVTRAVSCLTNLSDIQYFAEGSTVPIENLAQSSTLCYSTYFDKILFADVNKVKIYNLDGSYSSSFDFDYNTAVGIATDSLGNVFVGDNNAEKLVKYSSTGTKLHEWSRNGPLDCSIYEQDGKIYLVSNGLNENYSRGNVQIYDVTSNTISILVLSYEFDSSIAANGSYIHQSDGTYINVDSNSGNIFGSTL